MNKYFSILFSGLIIVSQGVVAEGFSSDCCGRGNFFVGADWLNWKTEQTKMEFAANVNQVAGPGGVVVTSTPVEPKFKSDNGYRVFGGYETCNNEWIFQASYTSLPTKASVFVDDTGSATNAITVLNQNFPLLTALTAIPFTTVGGKWDSNVNYLDLDVARNFSVCDRVQIIPHIGLRGLWTNQTFNMNGTAPALTFQSKLKQKIEGIGVEGGLWGDIDCGCGFAVVGHIGGSLLYSRFHNSGNLLASEGPLLIQYKNKMNQATPMVDSFIGVRYERSVCNRMVSLHIGWEQHIIFAANQFSVSGGGNVVLQGLTLGGSVAY